MALGGATKGITIQFKGDTTSLGKAMTEINNKAKSVDKALRDVNKALKFNPGNTELVAQKQELLKQKITQTKDRLEALKAAQAKMDEDPSVDKTSQEYMELRREIIQTESKLTHFENELKKLDYAKVEQLGKKFQQAGEKMTAAGKSMTRYVTTPILGVGAAVVKVGSEFDAQMSKVSAIAGATGKDFDALRAKAREMGAKTKFSATEAGQGFEYMAMAGWKTGDMLDGIEPVLNLAAASGEELGKTSDIVTDALTAFGLKAKDAGHFSDILAQASRNANTNVSMMGETFKYVAPVAGTLGYDAEDVATGIGLMANQGIKASQAGTALRAGLLRLAAPTKKVSEAMTGLGVDIKDSSGNILPFKDLLVQLREKYKGLDKSAQVMHADMMFGKNAAAGWLAMINASDKDFKTLTASIDSCDGAAKEMAETMLDNNAGAFTILKSALSEAAIALNDRLAPAVEAGVAFVQKIVDAFNKLSPKTQDVIIKIAALAAAVGPLLLVFGKIATGVGTLMTKWGTLVTSGGKLGATLSKLPSLFSPIGLAIGAIAAALVIAYTKSESFRKAVNGLVGTIGEALKPAINAIGNALKTLMGVIGQLVTTLADVLAPVIKALTPVISFIAKGIGLVIQIIGELIAVIAKMCSGVLSVVGAVFKTVYNLIVTPIKAAYDFIKKTVGAIAKALGFAGIKKTVEDVFNAVKAKIWKPIKEAKDKISEIIEKIKKWFPIDVGKLITFTLPKIGKSYKERKEKGGGSIGQYSFSVSGWEKHAAGGVFKRPTLLPSISGAGHLVGEAGAEAILPLDKLWSQMDKMAERIGGGQNINATYYITVEGSKDPAQFAKELVTGLKMEIRTV